MKQNVYAMKNIKNYINEYKIIRVVYISIVNYVIFILAVHTMLHISFTAYAKVKHKKSELTKIKSREYIYFCYESYICCPFSFFSPFFTAHAETKRLVI